MHAEGLESATRAQVSLETLPRATLASRMLCKFFNCIHTSIYARQVGTEFQISHLLQLTLFLISGLTYQEVDDIVELDPHIVVIWK